MPGSVLRQYREMRNYSQDYVAKKMGISQNAYSKIENGITQLTVNHIKQISRALDVSIIDLLRDDFEIHAPSNIQMESIGKEALIQMLEKLSLRLASKHSEKHEFYPVIMALLQSVDTTISNVR